MTKDFPREIKPAVSGLKKYRLAGVSFFVLNMLYIFIAMWKLPPVDPAMNQVVYAGLFIFVFLVLILTPLIFCGKRLLVQVLTVIYGGRAAYSVYSLIGGGTFPALALATRVHVDALGIVKQVVQIGDDGHRRNRFQ